MQALPIVTHDYQIVGPKPEPVFGGSVGQFMIDCLKENANVESLVDSNSGQIVTSATILQDVVTVAEALRARGVRPGDVVGICSENRLEFAAPVIAVLAVGATCAPLNPIYTISELEHTMSISKPKLVFCSPFTFQKIDEVKGKLPFVKDMIVFGNEVESEEGYTAYKDLLTRPASIANFRCTPVDIKDAVGVVLCSSGTTGLPKVVELTHFNLLSFLGYLRDPRCTNTTNEDILLGLIPFFHGYGYGVLLLCLSAGIKIIVMSSFQEQHFLETIEKYKITLLFLVPPILVLLAKHPLVDKYDLSSVRDIRCGAAPLSREVQEAVQKRLRLNDVSQGYGMTELSIACVITPYGINKFGASGVPAPGMICKVIDVETGKSLPPFKEGELCFRGPLVMKGYTNNPTATREMIDNQGWCHTGDIGYYDNDGFLYLVDRLKELIKYKGFQVPPAELEALLLTHHAVKDAAVIGIADEEAGELPLAFVVKQPDVEVTEKELKDFVAGKVSAQKRLHGGVRFLAEIPKNPSGKILRRELRALMKSKL